MRGFTVVNIFVSLFTLSSMAVTSSQEIHKEMTPAELSETFPSHDNIPDYEVVPIHWPREKRDVQGHSGVSLKAFGKHIKLRLNPVEGVLVGDKMPIYAARTTDDGVEVNKYDEPMKHMKKYIYEDPMKAATLLVNPGSQRHGNYRRMTGYVGDENLVIRPVQSRHLDRVRRHRRSIDGDQLTEDHHYHVVYKRDANHIRPLRSSSQSTEIKQGIPKIVYPEILVVVDYDLYGKFDYSLWNLVPYLLGFWNGVDMGYRELQNPTYRLNIAGIVVPLDPEAFYFVRESIYEDQTLNGDKNLDRFGNWLRKHNDTIPPTSYDIAAFMTPKNFCSMWGDTCGGGIVGQAFPGGACMGNNPHERMGKVMHFQDLGGFDGIMPAIHELGHSLGAHHDNADDGMCASKYGLIMSSSPRYNMNGTTWSRCSLSYFTKFLETEPKCLYNKPEQGQNFPRFMPGRIMNADEQCKRIKGTKAYKLDPSICLNLACISPDGSSEYVHAGSPAADGTSCGRGRICVKGRCLWERYITW